MRLITAAHPGDPLLDMAVTHALLRRVAARELPPVARVFVPGRTVALSRLDALQAGYRDAAAAAVAQGWTPVLRLGGGQAAAYGPGSIVLELIAATDGVDADVEGRFAAGAALLVEALARVGVAGEVGELPREYCPGRWSIHLPGGPKVAGAAQRNVRGASLFSAAVVVTGGDALREVLVPVYAALGREWDPATAGAVEDGAPGVRAGDVAAALTSRLAQVHGPLEAGALDGATLALAGELAAGHAP